MFDQNEQIMNSMKEEFKEMKHKIRCSEDTVNSGIKQIYKNKKDLTELI